MQPMSVPGKAPPPDDERYPKWLAQRSVVLVPPTRVVL